jgi:transcriptional regulator with XRE-family HTH domain
MSKRKAAAKKAADNRRTKDFSNALLRNKAVDMLNKGFLRARIAEQMNVTPATVTRWLREAGITPLKRGRGADKIDPANPTEPEFVDYMMGEEEPETDEFQQHLAEIADSTLQDPLSEARDEEERSILEIADSQGTPADKYQAFIAANAIRMFRDSMPHIRGPRTVKEMSELDQLIRRNLGLNPRGGSGGAGSVQIDISILNNTKADVGGSALPARNVTLDAEILNEEDDDEED